MLIKKTNYLNIHALYEVIYTCKLQQSHWDNKSSHPKNTWSGVASPKQVAHQLTLLIEQLNIEVNGLDNIGAHSVKT